MAILTSKMGRAFVTIHASKVGTTFLTIFTWIKAILACCACCTRAFGTMLVDIAAVLGFVLFALARSIIKLVALNSCLTFLTTIGVRISALVTFLTSKFWRACVTFVTGKIWWTRSTFRATPVISAFVTFVTDKI